VDQPGEGRRGHAPLPPRCAPLPLSHPGSATVGSGEKCWARCMKTVSFGPRSSMELVWLLFFWCRYSTPQLWSQFRFIESWKCQILKFVLHKISIFCFACRGGSVSSSSSSSSCSVESQSTYGSQSGLGSSAIYAWLAALQKHHKLSPHGAIYDMSEIVLARGRSVF